MVENVGLKLRGASAEKGAIVDEEAIPLVPTNPGPAKQERASDDVKPRRPRNALLDNAKMVLMFFVIAGHALQTPVDQLANADYGFQETNALKGARDTMVFAHMAVFMFLSGAVSSPTMTTESLGKNFVLLILPIILFKSLFCRFFVSNLVNEWYQWDFWSDMGSELFTSKEPWYLKALFLLRIMLACLGNKVSSLTMITLVGVGTTVFFLHMYGRFNYKDETIMYKVGEVGVWFFFGFLAKKHELLDSYTSFLRERPTLRYMGFAVTIVMFLVAMDQGQGIAEMALPSAFVTDWSSEGNIQPRMLGKGLFFLCFQFIYGVVWLSWIPFDDVPWVTEAGTRTIAAYISGGWWNYWTYNTARIFAEQMSGAHMQRFVSFWLFFMSLVGLMVTTSKTYTWILWPVFYPAWFAAQILEKELPPNPWYKEYGFKLWMPCFVAFCISVQVMMFFAKKEFGWLPQCSA
mmetsp:Transcript_42127/g.51143  ORF Transcript_42127/g.51143 Transcript_42127/m.51143 type:complete len:462 (+) Transcript_42127:168-1553(+)|eukprot:CAMPEP_0197861260 /NCGR_PEP_ID=MMETSP1438-20131217/37180_1 /TAXON_ID=1461541 /ORGANISM="Pterosperma sp., Strain CCMP1384" /LENGTH=461 /DNA_ID=CAMNT_0043478375 /DNA_START=157 /DNA_END=1542 /DNA_ORIENTATION=-